MRLESLSTEEQEKVRKQLKIKLLEKEAIWLLDESHHEEWYEEGINLYSQLIHFDPFNQAHYTNQLANLYLEKAIDEKMYHGNIRTAEQLLMRVIDLDPNHSQIYYRLAFINEHYKKWEAVIFYANEAFEYGVSEEEEIKLSALMGYAYRNIGLINRAKDQFEHAKQLDAERDWYLFIEHYEELVKRRQQRRTLTHDEDISLERTLQSLREDFCYVLNFYSNKNVLITIDFEIKLTLKEAELLAFLIKQDDQAVSNATLLQHIWPELAISNPKSSVVKKTIRELRIKLSDHSLVSFIATESHGYKLNSPREVKIVQGMNFQRLSCK